MKMNDLDFNYQNMKKRNIIIRRKSIGLNFGCVMDMHTNITIKNMTEDYRFYLFKIKCS